MRYPYDMWAHLITIDNNFDYTSIQEGRRVWHLLWREIFEFIGVAREDILLRAKIIHVSQTLISFGSIYLFSLVVVRNLYSTVISLHHHYMAYWSTIIWFSIFATFSTFYHHTWIMWYSISYQITLPLFFYITALTLILFLEKTTILKKVLYIIQVVVLSLFILKVHSMEYFYYLLYMTVLLIVFSKETFRVVKRYFYIFIPLLILFIMFTNSYHSDESRVVTYLSNFQFIKLYHLIIYEGDILIGGLNRADASINELMYIILFFTSIMTISLFQKHLTISLKVYIFILVTSLFILIPLFSFSAGLASSFTKISVVNRIYYSSSLFILLPISIYYIASYHRRTLVLFNISILFILLATIFYSKNYSSKNTYYANIQSLKQSIFRKKVAFNLSKEEIDIIGKELKIYQKDTNKTKTTLFWARADIAVVLKYIYQENVFWRGRRATLSIKKFNDYCSTLNPEENRCIVFTTPKGFPEYKPDY